MATERADPSGAEQPAANEVRLTGRVTSGPEQRTLPSGDPIVTFRLSVARGPTPMTRGSRQRSDWLDCVAHGARVRRSASAWSPGDVVSVEGELRRRFYRSGEGSATRVEVEVLRATRVARA